MPEPVTISAAVSAAVAEVAAVVAEVANVLSMISKMPTADQVIQRPANNTPKQR